MGSRNTSFFIWNHQLFYLPLLKIKMYGKELYKWLFHYNIYTHKWCAFTREDYLDYFNGKKDPISSSNIDTLIEIVGKTGGDLSKLKLENSK